MTDQFRIGFIGSGYIADAHAELTGFVGVVAARKAFAATLAAVQSALTRTVRETPR